MILGDIAGARSAMKAGHNFNPDALEFITALIQIGGQASEVNFLKKLARSAKPFPPLTSLMPAFEDAVLSQGEGKSLEVIFAARENLDRRDYQAVLDILAENSGLEDVPEAQRILGDAAMALGLFDLAATACRRVLKSDSNAHNDAIRLGNALAAEGKEEAFRIYKNVTETADTLSMIEAAGRLAELHEIQGQREKALAWSEFANEYLQQFSGAPSLTQQINGNTHISKPEKLRVVNIINERALIEYCDILEALVRFYDKKNFELIIYQQYDTPHPLTTILKTRVDDWLETYEVNDATLEHIIVNDGVHIIVDWCGLYRGHRQPVLASRPAGLNVSFVGLLPRQLVCVMDAWLNFNQEDGKSSFYIDIPGATGLVPFAERADYRADLPSDNTGQITFGGGCDLARVLSSADAWSRVLSSVPGSVIWLADVENVGTNFKKRVRERFSAYNMENRVFIIDAAQRWASKAHMLAKVDIVLDYVCSGGRHIILEALQLGIPVAGHAGGDRAAACNQSIFSFLGLNELLGANDDEFVTIAAKLAEDSVLRSKIRRELPQVIASSPLGDAEMCVRSIESALLAAWEECSRYKN